MLATAASKRLVRFVVKLQAKTAVARHDPLFSELRDPASSESNVKELLVEVPADNWADHMESDEGLAESEPEPSESASQPQIGLSAFHDDNDMLDIGLDMHG